MVKAPSSLNSNIATGCLLDTSSLPAILVAVAAAPIALWGSWVPAVITGLILLIIDASSPLQQHVKLIIQNVLRRQLVTVQEQSSTQTYQDAPLLQCVIHSSQETSFVVREAEIHDVNRLQELYMQNYVMSHSRQYSGLISSARTEDWESALGQIDFQGVLEEQLRTRKATKRQGQGSVRLLVCTQQFTGADGAQASHHKLVGYVLYELRSKGHSRSKQRSCELVNIVVLSSCPGNSSGRRLFGALCDDLQKTAPAEAQDLRLYVAERNLTPLEWYHRLGFKESGGQSEIVSGTSVRFLRMILRSQ